MKTRKQFTLVEILVAIGIVVILAGMLLAGMGGVLGKGENAKAKSEIITLRNAIAAFEQEYNKLPKPKNYNGTVLKDDPNDKKKEYYKWLILTLQGEPIPSDLAPLGEFNTKKKRFLDVQGNTAGELKDPWDEPYRVVFEKSHDKGIQYGDGQNVPGLLAKNDKIHQSVVIWSKGEDTKDDASAGKKVNEDNIYSVETSWAKGSGHNIVK